MSISQFKYSILLIGCLVVISTTSIRIINAQRDDFESQAQRLNRYALENRERISELQRRVYQLEVAKETTDQAYRQVIINTERLNILERQMNQVYEIGRWLLLQAALYFIQLAATIFPWMSKRRSDANQG